MPTKAKVITAILNWNGSKMLQKFLPSVVKYSTGEDRAVAVIDNCSDDDSVDVLKAKFPEVGIITLDRNYGFAEGYNRGLEQLDAEYFVLLNSDVEVTEGWMDSIIRLMDSNRDIAAAQPKLMSEKAKDTFEYSGACGGYIDRLGYPFCRGRIFGTLEKDKGQYDTTAEIFWASGAAMFVRADVYRKAGGLDKRFFAHMEEIDLCWRIKNMGYRIVCVPTSKVYHVGGATLDKSNPLKTYLNFRNNLYMLYKNLPDNRLATVMAARMWLDLTAAAMFMMKGLRKDAAAVIKAGRDFRRMKKELQADRQALPHRDTDTLTGMSRISIIAQYHLKGRKTFSSLPMEPTNIRTR